jgi:hypothetical protein
MVTSFEIDEFRKRAKDLGYDDSWIESEVQKKQQEDQSSQSITNNAPAATQTGQKQQQLSTKLPIYDQNTGEKILVEPKDAPNYGLSSETALQQLTAMRDSERISLGLPVGEEKFNAAAEDKQRVKDEVYSNAVALYDVLERGKSGVLQGKEYQDALNYAASKLAASRGFSEGGKSLTGAELSTLAGSKPVITPPRKQNFLEKITGDVPPETGKLVDNEATLRNKALLLIGDQDFGGDQGKRFAQSQAPELFSGVAGVKKAQIKTPEDKQFSLLQSAFNLTIKPIVDGAKGFMQLTEAAGGSALFTAEKSGVTDILSSTQEDDLQRVIEPIVNQKYANPEQIIMSSALDALGAAGAAVDIFTLGKATAAKGLITGGVEGVSRLGLANMAINAPLYGIGSAVKAYREGQNPDKAFVMGLTGQETTGLFEGVLGASTAAKQADTALALFLPIVASRQNNIYSKIMRGDIMKPTETPTGSITSLFGKAAYGNESRLGQAATSLVGIADTKSVTESEQLAQNLIAITSKNTPKEIARELPDLVAKSGNFIDSRVSAIDNIIGPQSRIDVLGDIFSKVEQTSAAQARPDLLVKYKEIIRSKLQGHIPETTPNGASALEFVNLSDVNSTRKFSNKAINSRWFGNGMPLTSDADYLNMMHFVGSQTMKDIMGQADETGKLGKAIEVQHIALSGEPVISQKAYNKTGPSIQGRTTLLVNVWNHTVGSILDAGRTDLVRSQVTGSDVGQVAQDIRSGQGAQDISTPLQPIGQQPAAPAPSGSRLPLPKAKQAEQVVATVQPAVQSQQSQQPEPRKLVRDNRYKQGNPKYRAR